MSTKVQALPLSRHRTRIATAIVWAFVQPPALAQASHLLCKPLKPSLYDEVLCTGDSRFCGRIFEIDVKTQRIREIPPTPDSPPTKWSEVTWSGGFIEMKYPDRIQRWPNGRTAYVVRGKETLNRFTRELVTAYGTYDADDRYLPKDEALQIGRALGADLVVAPSFGTTSYSCEQATRKL